MGKPYKSIQVFQSPLLERFTHVHPITPLFVWGPIVLGLLWYSIEVDQLDVYQIFLAGLAGLFTWTFMEYILHRFVFHYEGESQFGQRIHFLIHGLHHADPIDPTRLVMPPAGSLTIGGILYLGFRGLLGPDLIHPFFAFFGIGYLAYDYIHFAVHHFKPQTPIGKYLKHSHMLHHYVSPNSRWGVSSPLWDSLFNSLEDVKRVNL